MVTEVTERCGRAHVDPPDVLHHCQHAAEHRSIIHRCTCEKVWFEADTRPPSEHGEQWECTRRARP